MFVALILSLGLPAGAAADIIISTTSVGTAVDTDGDDVGNQINTGGLIAGDNGDNSSEFRAVFKFDISDPATQSLLADPNARVTFSVTTTMVDFNDAPDGFDFGVFVASENFSRVVGARDFASNAVLAENVGVLSQGQVINVDVTDGVLGAFRRGDALAVIRIQGLTELPNGPFTQNGGRRDQARFGGAVGTGNGTTNDATLTVVPEPGSLGLIGAGSVLLLLRRRSARRLV